MTRVFGIAAITLLVLSIALAITLRVRYGVKRFVTPLSVRIDRQGRLWVLAHVILKSRSHIAKHAPYFIYRVRLH